MYAANQARQQTMAYTEADNIKSRGSMIGEPIRDPMEMPEVPRELELLNQSLNQLDNLVGDLCRRLQPVTMAVPVNPQPETSVKERECYSTAGNSIVALRSTVRQNIVTLRGLLESLAV